MEYLYTQFLDYSRNRNYYVSDKTCKYDSESILYIAQNSNPYCADTMQMIVVQKSNDDNQYDDQNNSNTLLLFHRGNYCALAHASAELLCESFMCLDLYSFKHTVQYILNIASTNIQQAKPKDNDYLQIAMAVLQKKMSITRTYCFLLAWKTVSVLLESWDL